jgi:flagellar hook-length control protein FliK
LINTTNPVQPNIGVFAGVEKTGVETGGFDFWNYLLGLNSNNLPENLDTDSLKLDNLKAENLESDRKENKKDDLLWNPMFPQVFTPNTSENFLTQNVSASDIEVDEGSNTLENLSHQTAKPKTFDSIAQPLDQKPVQTKPTETTKSLIEASLNPSIKEEVDRESKISLPVDQQAVVKVEKQERGNVSNYSSQPVQKREIEYLPEVKEKLALSQVKKYFTEQKRVEGETTPVVAATTSQKQVETEPAITSQVARSSEEGFPKTVRTKESAPKNLLESSLSKNNSEQLPQIQSPVSTQIFDAPKMTTQVAKTEVPELMTKVQTLAQNGGGKMVVTLNPPHLGEVEISVTTKGKKVEIEMISENSTSKSILESHFSELKNSIQAQDMVVSKFEVSVTKDVDLGSMRSQDFANFQSSQNFDTRGSFSQSSGQQQSNRQQPFLAERHILQERADFKPAASVGRVDLKI